MPLYEYVCPKHHAHVELHRFDARPDTVPCDRCPDTARYVLSAPARGIVTGSTNPSGLHVPPTRDGFRVTEATDTLVVREKGGGLVCVDYRCDNGHETMEVYDGDKPSTYACPECGAATVEVPGLPMVDWFTAEGFHASGGYYNRGLGKWVKSRADRQRIMDEQGVVEGYDDRTDVLKRAKVKAQEDEEDRIVWEMLQLPTPTDNAPANCNDAIKADLAAKHGWR